MKDFLERLEKLATTYPDVAISVASVSFIAFSIILNLYSKAFKEQIAALKERELNWKQENERLSERLLKVTGYENSYEEKLEQLRQTQRKLATYSDLEHELEEVQNSINQRIEVAAKAGKTSEELKDLEIESSQIQNVRYRLKLYREGLIETIEAAEDLSKHGEERVNSAVDSFFKKKRKKKSFISRMLFRR